MKKKTVNKMIDLLLRIEMDHHVEDIMSEIEGILREVPKNRKIDVLEARIAKLKGGTDETSTRSSRSTTSDRQETKE